MAAYAAKAPSGHNTQPWKFVPAEGGIAIRPDFTYSLPVVDSDNRELYISLGCAAENLMVASGHFGYEARITGRGTAGIEIALAKVGTITGDPLFGQIGERQTNRSVYNGEKIGGGPLEKLRSVRRENNIGIRFFGTGTPPADRLAGYIAQGNAAQMGDRAFREELLSWMRFNAKQARETGDGLSYRVFGNPPLPGWLARPVVRRFLKPRVQNRSDMKKIASSSHLVLFTTARDSAEEWIDLGRTLQRFALTATALGIASAFMNQPCEVAALAQDMQKSLLPGGECPTLLLRIGYAGVVPYSLRRKSEVRRE